MYKYIGEYPKNRENGWSDEAQGVCHDDFNWFFTQKGKLWKFPVGHDLDSQIEESDIDGEKIICNPYGHHLGDIDCRNGYIFVPVTEDGKPYIAVFSAEDLSYITRQVITRDGDYFHSLGWCAIDNSGEKLYTSDEHIAAYYGGVLDNYSPIIVYDIDYEAIADKSDHFLSYRAVLIIRTEGGSKTRLTHSQGGCFDEDNNLYLTNGCPPWLEQRGLFVFSVPKTLEKYQRYDIYRIARSKQDGVFKFKFKVSQGEEPEGITYWDLKKAGHEAPEISGVLHVIMIDNYGVNDDDLYFKHYERID